METSDLTDDFRLVMRLQWRIKRFPPLSGMRLVAELPAFRTPTTTAVGDQLVDVVTVLPILFDGGKTRPPFSQNLFRNRKTIGYNARHGVPPLQKLTVESDQRAGIRLFLCLQTKKPPPRLLRAGGSCEYSRGHPDSDFSYQSGVHCSAVSVAWRDQRERLRP